MKINEILSEWSVEINSSIFKSEIFCIALFSTNKELLYSNEYFKSLVENDSCDSFINPTFDKILNLDNSKNLIFDGFLTLGDCNSINISIISQIYRKQDKILIIGGVNAKQLFEQNATMHQLNREVNNLQRDLIRKNMALENTLDQLNDANLELKKLNADKDRFMQIISHDLRGPFNTLLTFSEILIENIHKYDINKVEMHLSEINKVSRNTYILLEDLLLWSKSQAGKLPFRPQVFVFSDICNPIIKSLNEDANKKGIKITFVEQTDLLLEADLNMFKTILRNLISNAIKFTNTNGEIKIYAEINKNTATITVSDNGIGISEENQTKLWNQSQQFSTYGTADEKGSGFGLSLCKDFVEKHNCKIWVESQLRQGSNFKFTMPLYKESENKNDFVLI